MRRRGCCWVVLALGVWAAPSTAQTCPTREGTAAGGRSDAARLDFLSTQLLAESGRAHRWTLGWSTTYGMLALGQAAVVAQVAPEEQVDWWIGAAATAVGVAFTLVDPLEVMDAGPGFAKRAAKPTDVCALIAEGEGLLERGAAQEQSGAAWYLHAVNVAFNVGVGLILGLGYGHWASGAVNAALGVALGEGTLLTAPRHLVSAWSGYQRGELGGEVPISVSVFPLVLPRGAGLGLTLRF